MKSLRSGMLWNTVTLTETKWFSKEISIWNRNRSKWYMLERGFTRFSMKLKLIKLNFVHPNLIWVLDETQKKLFWIKCIFNLKLVNFDLCTYSCKKAICHSQGVCLHPSRPSSCVFLVYGRSTSALLSPRNTRHISLSYYRDCHLLSKTYPY